MADTYAVGQVSVINGRETPTIRPGVPSFLGQPVARTPKDLHTADVVVLGIPSQANASPGRDPSEWLGFQKSPEEVRMQSMRYRGFLPELELDVFEHLKLVDYGDVEIIEEDPEGSVQNVKRKVKEVIDAGCKLITLGGCVPTASYGVATGMAEAKPGIVGVISYDAHGDCRDNLNPRWGNTKPGPGTWQRRMWEHCPNIDPKHHVEIGMRGPRNVRESIDTYRAKGAHWYTAAKLREMGIIELCREAYPYAFNGSAQTWFSLCMDVLDISELVDWGDEPLGLSVADVVTGLHEAGKRGLDCLSVQFVPPGSRTAGSTVCYMVVYLMAGWVLSGKKNMRN